MENLKPDISGCSCALYHKNPNKLFRPWDYRKGLEKAYRRAITRPRQELLRLAAAAHKFFSKPPKRDRIQSKLARTLRRRFQKAFRYGAATSEITQKLVGCSLSELQQHLERQWQPGMTWENYGFYGWHIDHIKPVAKFDLTDLAQVTACFHFSNMQPLWMQDNFSKRDKLDCLNIKYRLRDGAGRTKTGFAFKEPVRTGRTSTGWVFREIIS